jgi:hypothetical protein
MLELTDAITNEVLEPITFILAYPTVFTVFPPSSEAAIHKMHPPPPQTSDAVRDCSCNSSHSGVKRQSDYWGICVPLTQMRLMSRQLPYINK